jgi:hypothetical protein
MFHVSLGSVELRVKFQPTGATKLNIQHPIKLKVKSTLN